MLKLKNAFNIFYLNQELLLKKSDYWDVHNNYIIDSNCQL